MDVIKQLKSLFNRKQTVMNDEKQVKVLFVCMGNICRSPTAHGVFQALVEEQNLSHAIGVDSAGTHSYHIGNPPDLRSQATALENGVDLAGLRGRKLVPQDLIDFNYVIGMDKDNITEIMAIKPDEFTAQVSLMLEYSDKYEQIEVPDPYFGNGGFDLVFDMISDASAGLLRHIRSQHGL